MGVWLWVCGSLALWVCGSVGGWLSGYVGVWLCGYVALWLCGSAALRLCGSATLSVYLCLCVSRSLWLCGPVALRPCGSAALLGHTRLCGSQRWTHLSKPMQHQVSLGGRVHPDVVQLPVHHLRTHAGISPSVAASHVIKRISRFKSAENEVKC